MEMGKIKRLLLTLGFLATLVPASAMIATPAIAACSASVCSGITIERLYINANGVSYVGTSGTETALNCTPESGVYLTLSPSDAQADWIYSLLLSHRISGKPLVIRIDDNSIGCTIQYVVSED